MTSSQHLLYFGKNFAKLEEKLGEIDRCRNIFEFVGQYSDPSKEEAFWEDWNEFEVYYSKEETFKDMMRSKRNTLAKFSNADIKYIET